MKDSKPVIITKASGNTAPFSEDKLRHSLQKAGADESQVQNIVDELLPKLYEGVSTKKIYRWAFILLRKSSHHLAARYNLKRAIMELGPSGYPFEKFIGEILKQQGYSVKTGEVVTGKCVTHEIDVIAEKDEQHFMIECKYHNLPGTVCDVKIPLYIQARFKDVEQQWLLLPGHSAKFHQGWVVTNTRFTSDAVKYGTCAGLHLLGWDFPKKESLKDLIDALRLHPVTCLTTLTRTEKQKLLDKKIVLCKEIYQDKNLLTSIGIKPSRINTVMEEATNLCSK